MIMNRDPKNSGKNYDAWFVRMPKQVSSIEELIPLVIDRANLAPSSHGTAPWIFKVEPSVAVVSPDLSRQLPISDPTGRQMYLSLGTAVANAKITANYYGFRVHEEIVNDHKLKVVVKRLKFSKGYKSTADDQKLFTAIAARVTNRGYHLNKPLPREIKKAFFKLNEKGKLEVQLIEEPDLKLQIGMLMNQADSLILTNPKFTSELSHWIRPNYTTEYDGMPGFGFPEVDDLDSTIMARAVKGGGIAARSARKDLELFNSKTAGVGVISAQSDNPAAWLQVGEMFQNFALQAVMQGLSVNVLAALVETQDYYQNLQKLAQTNLRPLIMFRIGFPENPNVPHAPRRPVSKLTEVGFGPQRGVLPLSQPKFFNLVKGKYELEDLRRELGFEVKINDRYFKYLADYLILTHPQWELDTEHDLNQLKKLIGEKSSEFVGVWVYLPWKEELIHILTKDQFLQLLYSRNNPCIEPEVQQKIAQLKVGVAGLSVGSNIAQSLVRMGITHLSITDFDDVDLSNLSRMSVGDITTIGERKTTVLARSLYEINPFLDLTIVSEGVDPSNLAEFMARIDVYIDHLDSLSTKIEARRLSRILRKIVLMATDIDKRPKIEIELPDNPQFFNGAIDQETIIDLTKPPKNFKDWVKKAHQIMGIDNLSAAVLDNFIQVIDKKQSYASQLGLTGSVVAGIMAYYVYEIARGNAKKLKTLRIIPIEQENLLDQLLIQKKKKEFLDKLN